MTPDAFYRLTELDRTTWPELRDRLMHYAPPDAHPLPRRYPGYPTIALDRVRARWWPSLDRALGSRRSIPNLGTELPDRKALSRLLYFAHGSHDAVGRGPTPSAGGLQGLELYVVNFDKGWLPGGVYHYDRAGHHLAQIVAEADRSVWQALIPSLTLVTGGAILWVIVGDGERVEAKYGSRGYRFLLLEAGHLMQNLCLLSASLELSTLPLGGFLEPDIARHLQLPKSDAVLYAGISGAVP